MRLMGNNIAALTLFLALALPTAADEIMEPPLSMMVGWEVNEVPANLSIYYDTDGDKEADIAFAHPIMATNTGVHCGAKVEEDEFYWVISSCPQEHATDYFVFKQWVLFKYVGEAWQAPFYSSKDYERTRTGGIREGKQVSWNQNADTGEKSCTGD